MIMSVHCYESNLALSYLLLPGVLVFVVKSSILTLVSEFLAFLETSDGHCSPVACHLI